MKTFLELLLRMSAYGSIAVLLVLVLRLLFKKFPKKTVILFWIVAAIRLVCPFNFETPVSLIKLAPQSVRSSLEPVGTNDPQTILEDITLGGDASDPQTSFGGVVSEDSADLRTSFGGVVPEDSADMQTSRGGVVPGEDVSDPQTSFGGVVFEDSADTQTSRGGVVLEDKGTREYETDETIGFAVTAVSEANSSLTGIMFIIWIIGAAAVVIYVTVGFVRTNRLVARLFRRSGNYLESERINTPFVCGIFSPKICVPTSLDMSEKDYMLLHEQIHIKNHDAIVKAFAIVVLCLHWFNPLVWVAVRLCMSDLEMRCDEEVVDILGERIRKDYCLSIVNHATDDTNIRVFTTAFAKKSISRMEIKMRIKNLIKYKKVSKLTTLTVLTIALAATFILTSCADTPATEAAVAANKSNGEIKIAIGDTSAAETGDTIVYDTGSTQSGSVSVTEEVAGDGETYIVVSDENENIVKYVRIENEDGSVEYRNVETNDIVGEGELAYSISINTTEGGFDVVEGEDADVILKYCKVYNDGIHEIERSNGDKFLTRTCEGAYFDSLEEFKTFYSYDNIKNVLDGVYETGDPRVKVAAWSRFLNEEDCKSDIVEEKNGCYVLTRNLDNGKMYFSLVYDCKTHDVTRLENGIPDVVG